MAREITQNYTLFLMHCLFQYIRNCEEIKQLHTDDRPEGKRQSSRRTWHSERGMK